MPMGGWQIFGSGDSAGCFHRIGRRRVSPIPFSCCGVPYNLLVGAEVPVFAALGTFVNLAELFS
jgi:hypothetical protein